MTARATLAALALLLGACCLPGEYCGDLEIGIVNETAEAVVVFAVDLIARTDSGDVVAVYEERLCNGDTWVIIGTNAPASSETRQVDLVGLVDANSALPRRWEAAR